MGQVTIYVEDGALDAARRAAERSQVSVSQWFAKFAVEEKNKQGQNWEAFFAEIDRLRDPPWQWWRQRLSIVGRNPRHRGARQTTPPQPAIIAPATTPTRH
jgi:hypothetical protein